MAIISLKRAEAAHRQAFLDFYGLGIYPVFFDRGLMCYGGALDEYLHERYPAPALLPADPTARAHIRLMSDEVRGWYAMTPANRDDALHEFLDEVDRTTAFFTGRVPSLVDAAAAPVLTNLSHERLVGRPKYVFDYIARLTEAFGRQ